MSLDTSRENVPVLENGKYTMLCITDGQVIVSSVEQYFSSKTSVGTSGSLTFP